MTASLAVIVPTRGRPENAARLATAFRETTSLGAVVVFVADHDDPELDGYRTLLDKGAIPRLMIPDSTSGRGMNAALNFAAVRYSAVYDHLGFMGDDHLPRTAGWDKRVLAELDSLEPRVVYGNDLLQGAALPTAAFLQSRMIRTMEMMAPRVLRHLYLDNFWKALGEHLGGLRYLDDVVIEHLHPIAGKAEWDERYQAVNSLEIDTADKIAWIEYCQDGSFDVLLRRVREEYGHAEG